MIAHRTVLLRQAQHVPASKALKYHRDCGNDIPILFDADYVNLSLYEPK